MNQEEKYLKLLAGNYPDIASAKSEIINLSAILSLPKGTEYFFSDLHGEYEAFINMLRSASGTIRDKITMLFSESMIESEQEELAHLIYFPEKILKQAKTEQEEWQKLTIYRMIRLCKELSLKYTRSKVRKKIPVEYSYAIDELLNVDTSDRDKRMYYTRIVDSIIEADAGKDFIQELCILSQRLAVDKLHILGDIFDRGPRADIIMNELMNFPDVDIQWGNHDISWIGAACGNQALIANVVRIAVSYNNFDLLEDGYGINLRPLSMFASHVYKEDKCSAFMPKLLDENMFDNVDIKLAAKMHKAIAVIQFKLEGQIIHRHPEYEMEDRNLLECIDYERGTVTIDQKEYPLKDMSFPTIDRNHPLELSTGEQELLNTLVASFRHCELLHRHVEFLYNKGGMYRCCNSNLLYHGCIPMNTDGSFTAMTLDGETLSGKALLDKISKITKDAYYARNGKKQEYVDFLWYLWCGKNSPLYGKSKLAAFEGYFIEDADIKIEIYNPYYSLSKQEDVCDKILKEFELDPKEAHIINGHVPVKLKDGEQPIKAGGKLYVIDGGISKAYQTKTGIAGYTLISNSHHIALAEHTSSPEGEVEVSPQMKITKVMPQRVRVKDTDDGRNVIEKIEDLKRLVKAYEEGIL